MNRPVLFAAVVAATTAAGTALTLGVYRAGWPTPDDFLGKVVGVALFHFLICQAYTVMGESEIEDAVKSGFFVVCGGVFLASPVPPLIGLSIISAAGFALVANQGFQRLSRT